MSSAEHWDERYAGEAGGLWSGHVNGALAAEAAGLAPGRALDVGCGEGADAIWLARRGWEVTGVDVSGVALERAAAAAAAAGVTVTWVRGDFAAADLPGGGFDLVSVLYPALPRGEDDHTADALLAAVAPGGVLLVVGHAGLDPAWWRARGLDPDDFVLPGTVAARLDAAWTVEVDETRPRAGAEHAGSHHTHDHVLRVRRTA
jgi:SAM-dependent methyltransferase